MMSEMGNTQGMTGMGPDAVNGMAQQGMQIGAQGMQNMPGMTDPNTVAGAKSGLLKTELKSTCENCGKPLEFAWKKGGEIYE